MIFDSDQMARLKSCGVTAHSNNDNGGCFRFVHEPGDECDMLVSGGTLTDSDWWSDWQDLHQHGCAFGVDPTVHEGVLQGICEVYMTVTGMMLFAQLICGQLHIYPVRPGDTVVIEPGNAHSMLVRPRSRVLIWKLATRRAVLNYGRSGRGHDWWPVPDEINNKLKALTPEEVAEKTGYTLQELLAT
jgi:hypothetical protein